MNLEFKEEMSIEDINEMEIFAIFAAAYLANEKQGRRYKNFLLAITKIIIAAQEAVRLGVPSDIPFYKVTESFIGWAKANWRELKCDIDTDNLPAKLVEFIDDPTQSLDKKIEARYVLSLIEEE